MNRVWLVRRSERPDPGYMASGGRSSALRERVASGEYAVDPHAVAEAMLSRMLVASQPFDRAPVRPRQNDAAAGLHRSEPGHG